MNANSTYQSLLQQLREIHSIEGAMALLEWDQQVSMPPGGSAGRGHQIATLAAMVHEKRTAPGFVEAVQSLRETSELPTEAQAVVRNVWHDLRPALKMDRELVMAISEAQSKTYNLWVEARKADRFAIVKDSLGQLIALKKEAAARIAETPNLYDAMIDQFEPGMNTATLDALFGPLRSFLTDLVRRIVDKAPTANIKPFTHEPISAAAQEAFCRETVAALGFRFDEGRLDTAVHPFMTHIGLGDVRLTTRYHERDLLGALMGTIHEAGHGMYEQGFPAEHNGTPLAQAVSFGIHESQSLLWEKQVGRSKALWTWLFPRLQQAFPAQLGGWKFDEFYRSLNRSNPSLIRVEADEVTYGLHIILRFELEKALIGGNLSLDDLPGAWSDKYREFLGLTPPSELTGVLQDIHWYGGSYGYFPSYLLGAVYAAQLFQAFRSAQPQGLDQIAHGDAGSLLTWLREQVHQHGRRFQADELLKLATGNAPSTEPYMQYLSGKYTEVYGL